MTNFVTRDTNNTPTRNKKMNFDEKAQENVVKSDLDNTETVNLSDKEKEMLKNNVQNINF